MAYTPQTWDDLPSTDTPLDASRLGHIEAGVQAAAAVADAALAAATTALPESYPVVVGVVASGDATGAADKISIDAALAAATAAGGGIVFLQAGTFYTTGNHADATKPVHIAGAGVGSTVVKSVASSARDVFTLRVQLSGVSNMTIDGSLSTGGDLVVLNTSHTSVGDVFFQSSAANAVTVGKTAAAVVCRLTNLFIRDSGAYGIRTLSGSTDGQWTNIDCGRSALSGIKLSGGGTNLLNVHAWSSGMFSATDNHGFWLNSGQNSLTGCEAESNLGNGVYEDYTFGNNKIDVESWGNCLAGYYATGTTLSKITGRIYNNGVVNTTGLTTLNYANVKLENSTHVTVAAEMFDNGASIPTPTYTLTPTYPYPGRSGIRTVSAHVGELGTSDYNLVVGNKMRADTTRTGVAFVGLGANTQWLVNDLGSVAVQSVPAAATLTLPAAGDVVHVSGTTSISAITAAWRGRRVTLRFTDSAPGTMTASGTLLLKGDAFDPAQNDCISLYCDGTNWYETSREINAPSLPKFAFSANYYFPLSTTAAGTNASLGVGSLRLAPVWLDTQTITAIGSEITGAGDVGSTLRLGIYNDNGGGLPGTLLLDAGTIAGDSATVQEITLGSALRINAGWYWLGGAVQVVSTTQPTVRTLSGLTLPTGWVMSASSALPSSGLTFSGYAQTAVTGALPGSWTAGAVPAGAPPRLFFKLQ